MDGQEPGAPSATSAPPKVHAQDAEDQKESEDSSAEEWDLNSPDDCLAYLEHFFPAAEAEALDINPDVFEKISRFFIKHLQNRLPKAPLSIQFRNEITNPRVMNSKAKRRDWLQAFAKARQMQFVQVPKKSKKP